MSTLAYWLLRSENQLLTTINECDGEVFPCGHAVDFGTPQGVLLVGAWRGLPCYAAEVDSIPEGVAGELMPVRSLFNLVDAETVLLVGRAAHLLDWKRNHRHCGRCGLPTIMKDSEFVMSCEACNLLVYPRISPAVMVLIRRDDELLLARSHRFKPGMFSALAGFVEAGETLEQCAVREVREEVGIEIANLRYFKSQPWPFPDSLMLAFFADYKGGTIRIDPTEIEDAGWFSPSALPILPDPVSIARQLIEAALKRT